MKKYTVIGLYPDCDWGNGMREASFVEWVEAESPIDAAHAVQNNFAGQQEGDPEDYCVLAVFEGALTDLYDPANDPALSAERAEEMAAANANARRTPAA